LPSHPRGQSEPPPRQQQQQQHQPRTCSMRYNGEMLVASVC
jgi:hypothetical protein